MCSVLSLAWDSGLPWWLSGKEPTCRCRRCGFNPWVRKIPWRRAWLPTPIFLPGKSHGQRSLAGYHPWGCKGSDTTEKLNNDNKWDSLILIKTCDELSLLEVLFLCHFYLEPHVRNEQGSQCPPWKYKPLCLQGIVSIDCPLSGRNLAWDLPFLTVWEEPWNRYQVLMISEADENNQETCTQISVLSSPSWRFIHCEALYVFKGEAVREGPESSLQFLKNLPTDRLVCWPNFPGKGYPIGQSANSRFWCTVKKYGHQIEKAAGVESCPLRRR